MNRRCYWFLIVPYHFHYLRLPLLGCIVLLYLLLYSAGYLQPSLLGGYKSRCSSLPPAWCTYWRKTASLIWVDFTASSGPAWICIAIMSSYKAQKRLQGCISCGLPWPAASLFFFSCFSQKREKETKPIAIPPLGLFPELRFSLYHPHTSCLSAFLDYYYFFFRNCHYLIDCMFYLLTVYIRFVFYLFDESISVPWY